MLDNQLKKQAKLRESIFAIVFMLVFCYFGFSTFYSPKKQEITKFNTQIKEVVEKRTGVEKLIATLKDKYESQKTDMEKQAQMAETLDPRIQMLKNQTESNFQNINQFLGQITRIDFRSKLTIKSLRYDLPVTKTGYKETKFYLNATGRFVNVIEFLEKLETLPALVSIDNLSLQTNKNDADQVTLELNGNFYQLGSDNV